MDLKFLPNDNMPNAAYYALEDEIVLCCINPNKRSPACVGWADYIRQYQPVLIEDEEGEVHERIEEVGAQALCSQMVTDPAHGGIFTQERQTLFAHLAPALEVVRFLGPTWNYYQGVIFDHEMNLDPPLNEWFADDMRPAKLTFCMAVMLCGGELAIRKTVPDLAQQRAARFWSIMGQLPMDMQRVLAQCVVQPNNAFAVPGNMHMNKFAWTVAIDFAKDA